MRFVENVRFVVAMFLSFAISLLFTTAGLMFIIKVSPMYSSAIEMWLSVVVICVVGAIIATKLPEKFIAFMRKDDER